MKRRRFLQIVGAAALCGTSAQAATWQGHALGAEAGITLRGGALPKETLAHIRAELARIEAVFSLHQPSELTQLNATGRAAVSPALRAVLDEALMVHGATDGAFDPSVQPVWAALAAGRAPVAAPHRLRDIKIGHDIRLARGQALTLNGIAQGYATDRIAAMLASAGYRDCLINIGEFAALGGDFRLGIEDPEAGILGQITLRAGRAVATSAPGALRFTDGQGHILGPDGQRPRWSSVTVEARTAMRADAASTGFVLMERPAIERAKARLGLGPVRLVDAEGGLVTL